MTDDLELASGTLRCAIKPALGGCIAGLWLGSVPVLRSTAPEHLSSARLAGSYPLVPFSNRVANAALSWQGTSHPLVHSQGSEPHAIHGLGWQRPWQVLDADAQFAILALSHRADAAWPFSFDCTQSFRVSGDGIELTLSITNQSPQAAPVGLGWHPYFVKRPGARVAFAATGRWEMGPDKLPTQRRPATGLETECAGLVVDHCFDGWHGLVELTDALLQVRVSSSLSRLVVFTEPSRDFVAIEPVSHVNNAVNLVAAGANAQDLGLQVLAPGESVTAQMHIGVRAAR